MDDEGGAHDPRLINIQMLRCNLRGFACNWSLISYRGKFEILNRTIRVDPELVNHPLNGVGFEGGIA